MHKQNGVNTEQLIHTQNASFSKKLIPSSNFFGRYELFFKLLTTLERTWIQKNQHQVMHMIYVQPNIWSKTDIRKSPIWNVCAPATFY